MTHENLVYFLIADDDVEDCEIFTRAVKRSELNIHLNFVKNGEELLSYMRREHPFNDDERYPLPDLIILDWNMPRKNGIETLTELKLSSELKKFPVVFLTTSNSEEDILRAYNLGVNSYIKKPVEFETLVQLLRDIDHYWFENVTLPKRQGEK